MSEVFTIPQLDRYLGNLKDPGRRGWSPVHNKLGKYYRNKAKDRMNRHVGVDGKPWAAGYHEPRWKVGDYVPMLLSHGEGVHNPQSVNDGGSVVTQIAKTVKGSRAARRFRKKYGPPVKPDTKPLIITRGKKKKRVIWDFLRKPGRSTRVTKTSFSYGYTPGTRWIEKLQNGGMYKGQRVPARSILGITKADELFTESAYADYYEKVRLKGRS